MRLALVWCLVLPAAALADATVPKARSGPAWVGRCAERLLRARDDAARFEPVFQLARVDEVRRGDLFPGAEDADAIEGVELHFDESTLGLSGESVTFAAQVRARRSLWSDPGATSDRWTLGPTRDPRDLQFIRQTRALEGTVAVHRVWRRVTSPSIARLVENIFKPALDDCLRTL
jgi:hypothetical protein